MTDTNALSLEVALWLTKILHREVDPNNPNADLIEDYGADSMDVVDTVEMVEKKYGIKVANEQIPNMRTFGDLLRLIQTPQ